MIAAGMLNRFIVIEHLRVERDGYGSDIEKWTPVHRCMANVKGSDGASLINSNDETVIRNSLLFTVRKFPIPDLPNHYRIVYGRKVFTVLNINNEDRDNTVIFTMLKNE
jgi:SPP1 family predicted phage head-tail adaptor